MKARKQPSPDLETIIPLLINHWRRMTDLGGPPDRLQTREFRSVVEKIKALQEGVIEGDALHSTDYFADKELLGAYSLYYWILHYQQGLSLINEIPSPPKRVLDLCAGPCPFSFAALRHGAHEVIAVDRNMEALQWGAQIAGRYGMPLTIRQGDCSKPLKNVEGSFDLIILGYALRELFPLVDENPAQQEAAAQFLVRLGQQLTPTGSILLVDSSLFKINRSILHIRNLLVEKKVPMKAPCIWQGSCPALERSDTPCYAQRQMEKPYFVSEIQRAAQIQLSSLKMSYLLLGAPNTSPPSTNNLPLYRVISPPFESHYGVTYYLCGVDGKKKLSGNPKIVTEGNKAFAYLQRGDVISIENAAERGNALEVTAQTLLKVIAAPGKSWSFEKESF